MDTTPAEQPQTVQGELGLGTLPSLIRKLHEERRTGTLRIRARGAERRVHFKWGAVVFAASDRSDDRLDRRLRAEDLVAQDVLEQARGVQQSTGKRFGECLIELGAMTEAEVLAAVERQVRSIVTFLFSLDRGEYQFEETEDPIEQDLALDLPMREIIVEGIRSMEDPIALQIGVGSMTDYLHAGLASETANVNAAEGFVLSRVDGRTNILDLLSVSPLGEIETLKSICALLAVGIVEAKPEPLDKPEPKASATPPGVGATGAARATGGVCARIRAGAGARGPGGERRVPRSVPRALPRAFCRRASSRGFCRGQTRARRSALPGRPTALRGRKVSRSHRRSHGGGAARR